MSSRDLGEALDVDHVTILNDRKALAGEDSPPDEPEMPDKEEPAGEDSPPDEARRPAPAASCAPERDE